MLLNKVGEYLPEQLLFGKSNNLYSKVYVFMGMSSNMCISPRCQVFQSRPITFFFLSESTWPIPVYCSTLALALEAGGWHPFLIRLTELVNLESVILLNSRITLLNVDLTFFF